MVIFRFTYGYQRKTVIMTTPQIIERTGLSGRTIEKARAILVRDRIITTERNGYRGAIEYAINKNYDQWPCFEKLSTAPCGKPVNCSDDYTQNVR